MDVLHYDPSGEFAQIKVPAIDLAEPGLLGAVFTDEIDPTTQFQIYNFGETDPEDPEKIFADLAIIDTEFQEQTTWRVRVNKRLREASQLTWEFVDEHKKVITILGGIATGAFIGVMTLYKVRQKYSSEE